MGRCHVQYLKPLQEITEEAFVLSLQFTSEFVLLFLAPGRRERTGDNLEVLRAMLTSHKTRCTHKQRLKQAELCSDRVLMEVGGN